MYIVSEMYLHVLFRNGIIGFCYLLRRIDDFYRIIRFGRNLTDRPDTSTTLGVVSEGPLKWWSSSTKVKSGGGPWFEMRLRNDY